VTPLLFRGAGAAALLARQMTFEDPYDRRHAERVRHRAIQSLERQGSRVTLEPAA